MKIKVFIILGSDSSTYTLMNIWRANVKLEKFIGLYGPVDP